MTYWNTLPINWISVTSSVWETNNAKPKIYIQLTAVMRFYNLFLLQSHIKEANDIVDENCVAPHSLNHIFSALAREALHPLRWGVPLFFFFLIFLFCFVGLLFIVPMRLFKLIWMKKCPHTWHNDILVIWTCCNVSQIRIKPPLHTFLQYLWVAFDNTEKQKRWWQIPYLCPHNIDLDIP